MDSQLVRENATLTSVYFLDGRTGWAVGAGGNVWRYVLSYPARAYLPLAQVHSRLGNGFQVVSRSPEHETKVDDESASF